jgi:hypothetical protein
MYGTVLAADNPAADILIGLLGFALLLLGIVHLAWPKRVERVYKWLDNPKMPALLRPVPVEAFPSRIAGILQVAFGAFLLWVALLN